MEERRREQLSKSLSYYLRHHLEELNCEVSTDGYVPLSILLSLKSFRGATVADIELIVRECPKQRFSLKKIRSHETGPEEYYIRANQGHSIISAGKAHINPDEIYELITEPLPYCVHGTTRKVLPSIESDGLNRMSRTHIHFVSRSDAKSGYRKKSNVLIHINMEAAMRDGIQFYRSANDVILTEGLNGILEPKYFQQIELL